MQRRSMWKRAIGYLDLKRAPAEGVSGTFSIICPLVSDWFACPGYCGFYRYVGFMKLDIHF